MRRESRTRALAALLLLGAACATPAPTSTSTPAPTSNPERADPAPFEARSALDGYERQARQLVREAERGAPIADLAGRARALIASAEPLLGEVAVRYPPCGPYLRSALGVLDVLDSIGGEEMERAYHADGALPRAPGFCYHAKDLLVHPASVLVLARTERREPDAGRGRMRAEMQEALSHLAAVRQLFALADASGG